MHKRLITNRLTGFVFYSHSCSSLWRPNKFADKIRTIFFLAILAVSLVQCSINRFLILGFRVTQNSNSRYLQEITVTIIRFSFHSLNWFSLFSILQSRDILLTVFQSIYNPDFKSVIVELFSKCNINSFFQYEVHLIFAFYGYLQTLSQYSFPFQNKIFKFPNFFIILTKRKQLLEYPIKQISFRITSCKKLRREISFLNF